MELDACLCLVRARVDDDKGKVVILGCSFGNVLKMSQERVLSLVLVM